MGVGQFVALAALLLAAPLVASSTNVAVQPGGDIPARFDPPVRPPQAQIPPLPRYKNTSAAMREYLRREVDIPMRDGVRLHTVLILPRNATLAPIMLDRTPYSADSKTDVGYGPLPEHLLAPAYAELVRAGYIVAIQDVRGKYRSGGDYVMNRPLSGPLNPTVIDHSTDAWDSIEWLVRNVPESSGKVGTIGTSYNGFTALMSLIRPHPALKASVPINPMVDVWKGDDWFHNGAFRQEMISYVYNQTASKGDERIWQPDQAGPSGTGDDYAAYLAAGNAATYGRTMGMEQLPFWKRLLQHPDYDDYWQLQALDRIIARQGLSVPTLIVGGLWDQEDIYGATALFAAVKSSPNAYLALGPWFHGQVNHAGRFLGPFDLGADTARWFRLNVMIPFLDQRLKDAPPSNTAKVTAYQWGTNQWQRHDTWPLACRSGCPAPLTPLYFAGDAHLDFATPTAPGSSTYIADPANPVPYRARPNLSPWAQGSTWLTWLTDDQSFAQQRSDVLTFTGPVLTKPLTLAGTPLVHLVAATSGRDSDWVVKLIDVYPAGDARSPRPGGYQLAIAMDVLRSRYRNDPARPQPVPANVPVTYEFALPEVDYVVQPGHRLMVQVQSSWFPLYDRNPQTFVPSIFTASPASYRAASQRVFFGPEGSWIGLPLVR
ncbi:MAG: CocE/NonD family hydrolase [Sphingomicrobium sp.]